MSTTTQGKAFVKATHPTHAKFKEAWTRNETLHTGGDAVREYLRPFGWEDPAGDVFKGRQERAYYPRYPSIVTERFVGYLSQDGPQPGRGYTFGNLGDVRGRGERTGTPTAAELFWDDCDLSGTSFVSFMNHETRMSMVTGLRWIVVEMTPDAPSSKADEATNRPFLLGFSPRDVPNWLFMGRGLVAIVMSIQEPVFTDKGVELRDRRLFYVAKGPSAEYFTSVAGAATNGAWHVTDIDGVVLNDDVTGKPRMGDLAACGGDIPVALLWYERARNGEPVSGTDELGRAALVHMNLKSALDNDAHESGSRNLSVFGIDTAEYNEGADMAAKGSRIRAFPPSMRGNSPVSVTLHDSASVSGGTAILAAIKRTEEDAARMAMNELQTAPDSSGEARRAAFRGSVSPRLAAMSENREACENTILRLVSQRWGVEPTATVVWPRSFDVTDAAEDWREIMGAVAEAGVTSPTLTYLAVAALLESKGVDLTDDQLAAVLAEFQSEAASRQQAAAALGAYGDGADAATGDDPDGGDADPGAGVPSS